MNNKILRIIIVIGFISLIVMQSCYGAVGLGTNVGYSDIGGNELKTAENAVTRIWNSVKLILQVVSLSIVIACGVRYMMASADQKADIKKSLGYLALGCAIVFGTTFVIDFIRNVFGDLAGNNISNQFNSLH